ncbi:hypothetical protein OSSY52_21880 [Tepiditoga spiralis]|uniref:Tetratricopeptide repeat protein n=1 Tax=Tepiditoga spiralis TaxID=2108365 RepID=A0A7G1GAC2_9BACT|nr:hypothetical protein [Tepiditoga spiralis]BBE32047.1 hypothetical protein OSSY52_21880 [Tepiditoga spiralis]
MSENDKLEAIYKLKKEMEKDLKKKGGKIKSEEETEKKRTIYKPDKVLSGINIPFEKIKTWFDINLYDIEISDEKLSFYFESKLTNKSPGYFYNQFGLMHLLRNDYEKAEKFFLLGKDIESKFNYGVLKVFRKDEDALVYAKEIVNKYPQTGYPYLLLSLYFISVNNFDGAYKFLTTANKFLNYSFISLALSIYKKDFIASKAYLSKCFLENKAKKTITLLDYYMTLFGTDIDKRLSIFSSIRRENTPCAKCIETIQSKKGHETPEYCAFSQRINSILFLNESSKSYIFEKLDLNFINFFNANLKEEANKVYQSMIKIYGELDILFIPGSTNKMGLKTLEFITETTKYKMTLKGPDYYTELKTILKSLKNNYHKDFDFIINVPFYESLRLLFGWRTCKRLY